MRKNKLPLLLCLIFLSTWEDGHAFPTIVPSDQWISDAQAEETLARIYTENENTYPQAILYYHELIGKNIDTAFSLMELAEIYFYERKYHMALETYARIPSVAGNFSLELKKARLESILGFAWQSKRAFEALKDQASQKFWFEYATAMLRWGDYYEAEKIYASLDPEFKDEKILGKIDTLIATQQFMEGDAEILRQLDKNPVENTKVQLLLRMINSKYVQYDYKGALVYADQLLEIKPNAGNQLQKIILLYRAELYEEALRQSLDLANNKDYAARAYLAAGKASRMLGNYVAADEYFAMAEKDPYTRIQAAYYLAGDDAHTRAFVEKILGEENTPYALMDWVDRYQRDGDTGAMIAILENVITRYPDYFPAHIALAETLTSQEKYSDSFQIYEYLLSDMPDNSKLLLGLARVSAWNWDYAKSIAEYQTMIFLNPQDVIPRIEQARVAFWWKDYPLAMHLYEQLAILVKEEALSEKRIHTLCLEMAARKADWEYRYFERWGYLAAIYEQEPYNPIWKFEYAENFCTFNLCKAAIDLDRKLLKDVPGHALAELAIERDIQAESDGVNLSCSYWQEIGYGDLDQIGRYEEMFSIEHPFSCTKKLLVSQHFWDEHTFYDNHFHQAHGVSFLYRDEPTTWFAWSVGVEEKIYKEDFPSAFTGFLEIDIKFLDIHTLSGGFLAKNEMFNYFNLVQRTQGYVSWLALDSQWTHSLNTRWLLENVVYSDHNDLQHILFDGKYSFTEYPNVVSFELIGEWRNTKYTNIFIYNAAGALVDIIYPYWAPQEYYFGQASLTYRHDFGHYNFCNAPQRYFELQASGGDDNQGNHFCEFKGTFVYEGMRHWKIYVSGLIHKSPQWNAKGVWCSINYKF